MKANRFISVVSALAVALTSFVALATVSYATANTNSNPEINITFDYYDDTDGATFNVSLVNNEALNYSISKGKITENAINAIQVNLILDDTVFDVSGSALWDDSGNGLTSGDGTEELIYAFGPTTPATYMTDVPEPLFSFCAPLQAGYTEDNIPDSAVTFSIAILEYKKYNGVAASAGATYHTIYGHNVVTYDYPLTVSFTGTASSTPTPDPDPDPVEAAVDNTTGEVTLTRNANATLPASAVLDGQKVKLFSNEFTGVTANKRFAITHNGETKRYGTSIGEYFGINGNGTVSGIVKVAVLFPEGDENDFTINMYDAE